MQYRYLDLLFLPPHLKNHLALTRNFYYLLTWNLGKYFYRLKQIDINGDYNYSIILQVNFENQSVYLASDYYLAQNYPNPFNPNTTIQYSLPEDSHLRLTVYDILGREIAELFNGISEMGNYSIEFNGTQLENGIYYYRIQARSLDNNRIYTTTKKMTLIKWSENR